MYTNQITQWKVQLLERTVRRLEVVDPPVDVKTLHQLTLENDFLEGALIKAGASDDRPQPPSFGARPGCWASVGRVCITSRGR